MRDRVIIENESYDYRSDLIDTMKLHNKLQLEVLLDIRSILYSLPDVPGSVRDGKGAI